MACTFREMLEQLKHLDEMTLLEVLKLDSTQLVELLTDRIEEQQEHIRRSLAIED
jgi:hypothetical protein